MSLFLLAVGLLGESDSYTAKKRKLCSSSLNPDLLLEDKQATTEDGEVFGACIHAVQQERFG